MSTHSSKPAQRAAASIVATVLLCVAAPVTLMRVSRFRFDSANPLVGIDPPWQWRPEQIRATVSEPLSDDAVVNALVRAGLVVIWVALFVIACSILFEVVHMIRHRGIPAPRVRGIGWAQHIGRWVAAGLITVLPVVSQHSPALALAAPASAAVNDAAYSSTVVSDARPATVMALRHVTSEHASLPTSLPAHADRIASPSTGHVYTVIRGDSVFSIAASLAGGDERRTLDLADEILDLNLGNEMIDGQRFTNPALIQPGWQLDLPPMNSESGDLNPTTDTEATPDAPDAIATMHHVVEAGDSLSAIAADHLGDADAWTAVWEENRGEEMIDGRTFDDPNLILPGWELDVPVAPQQPEIEPRPSTSTDTPLEGADDVDSAGRTHPDLVPPPVVTAPTRQPDRAIPTTPSTPSTTAPVTSPTTTTTPPSLPDTPPAAPTDGSSPAPEAPSPLRLEHGALLAAGILTLVGVRRRRSLRAARPHTRLPMPPPEVAATERRLRALDAGERAARIDVASRAIAHQLVSAASDAQIGTIRAAADGELTFRLTAGASLHAPFVTDTRTGPGQTWTLPAAVPIELLSDDARQAGQPCHTLVTIGLDDAGHDVLMDLEAAGVTAIEATPEQGDAIARAIGSGLATSLTSEVAHLIVANLGTDCLYEHPNVRALDGVASAIDAAVALVGSTSTAERTTFDLRTCHTGGEMWEPAVMLFTHDDRAAEFIGSDALPASGHGVAIVAVTDRGEIPGPGARLSASSHSWLLDAFGESFEVQPIGMEADDVAEVAAVLDHAEATDDASAADVDVVTNADGDVDVEFEPAAHQIVVRLMGGVDVVDRDGTLGAFERSKTVELIAWLATHRERATRTGARTALWELDVRDATFANVVSEARRGLGRMVAPPVGEEWLARTLNESLPLHTHVVTDVDLMRERLDHARLASPSHAIELLRPAAEMIRDMPFAGTSYLWPDADGLTSELVLLATTITTELAEHALSIGDIDLVFWATGQGLTVLPGHEDLIGLRMRAHARAGDLAGVRQEWESYERVIVADSWSDGEPAPKLLHLRRELLSPG